MPNRSTHLVMPSASLRRKFLKPDPARLIESMTRCAWHRRDMSSGASASDRLVNGPPRQLPNCALSW